MIEMISFHLYFISANGYRGSTFPNIHAYVNVNGMWDLPAAIEQSEFDIQEDISDRLNQSEDSSILSTENALKDNTFHVTFITDVQMHELHTDIGANGSGLIGEFEVRKQIILANSYLIFFLVHVICYGTVIFFSCVWVKEVHGLWIFC